MRTLNAGLVPGCSVLISESLLTCVWLKATLAQVLLGSTEEAEYLRMSVPQGHESGESSCCTCMQ